MKKIILVLFCMLLAMSVFAEQNIFVGGKMLYFDRDLFSFGVREDGIGGKHDVFIQAFDDLMSTSNRASVHYESAKFNNMMSNIFGFGGLGLFVGSVIYTYNVDTTDTNAVLNWSWVFMGSLCSILAGEYYAFATYNDIYLTVHEYNKTICGKQASVDRDVFLVKRFEF